MHAEIVRTLKNIRHILNFKKKIISFGTLDSLRYKYSCKCGVIRVSKCSLIVKKDNKVDSWLLLTSGLYSDKFNCCVFFTWSKFKHYLLMAFAIESYEWEMYDNSEKVGYKTPKKRITWLLLLLCLREVMQNQFQYKYLQNEL